MLGKRYKRGVKKISFRDSEKERNRETKQQQGNEEMALYIFNCTGAWIYAKAGSL